ncbi:MAG: hypothetical protein IKK15_02075 [Akkermansia sp.]|nr:hypothetical protein [Akkermansia sp.]
MAKKRHRALWRALLKVTGCWSHGWWLRSPNPGNTNNVYNVNTTGTLNNNNANNTNAVAPD